MSAPGIVRGANWQRRTPARMLCAWHRAGRPPGASARFFVDGCEKCLEKLTAGLCERTDPTPMQLYLAHAKTSGYRYGTGKRR